MKLERFGFMITEDEKILVDLPTYQGLTDDEIQTIINVKVREGLASKEMMMKVQAELVRNEQIIIDNSEYLRNNMLNSTIEPEIIINPRFTPPSAITPAPFTYFTFTPAPYEPRNPVTPQRKGQENG